MKDMEKRKIYDTGAVKPPPGGWYQVSFLLCDLLMNNTNFLPRILTRRYSKMFKPGAGYEAGA